jgi:hypothetical protein
MDLYLAIQGLYVEKEKLELVIASLEELQRAAGLRVPPAPGSGQRRGRKSMSPEDRKEVSERMKKHWASRRVRLSKSAADCHSA